MFTTESVDWWVDKIELFCFFLIPVLRTFSLYFGPPDYSSSEDAERKSLSMDIVGTYMKVINPPYNHDPKSISFGANWETNFYPFCNETSSHI